MTRQTTVQGVIFDWAGTLVDFGSLAPTQIFVEAFAEFGINLSLEEARGPMGLSKWQHIQALLLQDNIARQWQARFQRSVSDNDITAIYERFMPMQIDKVAAYSAPIPGAVQTLQWLRERNIRIGSCSGYPMAVMDVLKPVAYANGIQPEHLVCGDELAAGGRPGAFMVLANMLALQLGDVRRCIKVDDTIPGIEEGLNAGMWTVGLSVSGNEMGLTEAQLAALDESERQARTQNAEFRLREAGAHYVIPSVIELPAVVEDIERRLSAGERP